MNLIQGKRVLLRAVEREDLARIWAFNNDLAIELAGGGDPPMPQSLARLEADFNNRIAGGGRDDGYFGIDVDGVLIGICALFNVEHLAGAAELGISIGDSSYQGRGYGREAVHLLLRYGFRYRNLHKIHLEVHARNERAIRTYRACGFQEEGRLREQVWGDGAYDDLVLMGILRSEWNDQSFA